MPLLRKTGARSPWLPQPIQGALERARPAVVVAALLPSFVLGGNAQFTSERAWRDDPGRVHANVAVSPAPQQPMGGGSVWMGRSLADVTPPADSEKLSPAQVVVNQPPVPAPSFWAPQVLRTANTDPLRPVRLQATPPDATLVHTHTLLIGRLARDEDTSRPARPASVMGPRAPLPGGSVVPFSAPRDPLLVHADRLSPTSVVCGQPPVPGANATVIGRIARTPLDRPALPLLAIGQQPVPIGQTFMARAPRAIEVQPDRLSPLQIIGHPPPTPLEERQRIGRITRTPLERVPWRGPLLVQTAGLPPPSAVTVALRARRDGATPPPSAIVGACATLTQQTKPRAVLTALAQPTATLALAARHATLTQRVMPMATLTQQAKPRAALTQRIC